MEWRQSPIAIEYVTFSIVSVTNVISVCEIKQHSAT